MFARPFADARGFTLSRRLDRACADVWSAFADLEKLRRWWGPSGWTWLGGALDFRPGGLFTYALRAPGGEEVHGALLYRDLVAPRRLGFVQVHAIGDRGRTPLPCLDAVVSLTETESGTLIEGRCRRRAGPPADLDIAWPWRGAMPAPAADGPAGTPFGRVS
jgi:uncharacterized protein YndB with AHSA1/START domain